MATDTETTRTLVKRFLDARSAGDYDAVHEMLADDAEWYAPASVNIGPFKGRDEVAKALCGGVAGSIFDMATVKRDVRSVIVDGSVAAVQQRLSATTVQGREYVNEYCWIYTCRGDRVQKLEEYADTLYAGKVFGWVKE
jgi:ketosteroid isomerase-like protein